MPQDYVPFNEAYHSRQHDFAAWKKRQPHGRQGVGHCICGLILTNQTEAKCGMHPEARLRTSNEQMDFAQAWDARVTAGRTKTPQEVTP